MTRLNNLLIRPILAEDLATIKAFCQRTWSEESDYIPDVLDRWVSALDGQVLVAVLDHEPVGMARIVQLSSTGGSQKVMIFRRVGGAHTTKNHYLNTTTQVQKVGGKG